MNAVAAALENAAADALLDTTPARTFKLGPYVYELQPLKLKTQRLVIQHLGRVVASVGVLAEGDTGSTALALGELAGQTDRLLEVICLLLADSGHEVTPEQLGEQRLKASELNEFVRQVLIANDDWGKPVLDFFEKLWREARKALAALEGLDGAEIATAALRSGS